jgi:GNAT superfamily N-acetyltransferase
VTSSPTSRVLRKLREVGPTYAAILGLRRIVPASALRLHRGTLYAADTAAATGLEPVPARWAQASDASLLTGFGHPRGVIDERLASGSRVCVLDEGGRLQAYVWFQPVQYVDPELRTRFVLRPGDIWLYDAMVAPDARGRGIYPRLLATALVMLRQLGFERVWIHIDDRNRNSIRAHCAAGAAPRERFSIVEICGAVRIRRGEAPAVWLGRGQSDLVVLEAAGRGSYSPARA